MENIKSIICESCSETAIEYDDNHIHVSSLEGHIDVCRSCTVIGRVSIDDEIESRIGFFPLRPSELSRVDFGTIVEGYEAAQAKIDELLEEIVRLKKEKK